MKDESYLELSSWFARCGLYILLCRFFDDRDAFLGTRKHRRISISVL